MRFCLANALGSLRSRHSKTRAVVCTLIGTTCLFLPPPRCHDGTSSKQTFCIVNTACAYATAAFQLQDLPWRALDDNVMGGLSSSRMTWSEELGSYILKGQVRLENNGGFASTRMNVNMNLSDFDGIYIDALSVVAGNGAENMNFVFTLKDPQAAQLQVTFKAQFQAGTSYDGFRRSYMLFSEMVPEYRGRQIDRGPIDEKKIVEIGIMGKQPGVVGDFELLVKSLGGFKLKRA
mmetsp:Transcript_115058/g.229106  ORF Transcript_115058/g.229106 Transcript_115058/m.229106 type:complete len:234 (+) Transcript_115058:45-746(+)